MLNSIKFSNLISREVNQLSSKLKAINWEYYRTHVHPDLVKMVDDFHIKYEELDHVFAARHEVLDHTKYYTEWESIAAQVKQDVKKFIEESNERIAIYEKEISRLKKLIPYEHMTLEQFVMGRPDIANLIPGQGRPLFWPHTADEQCVGTVMDCKDGEELAEEKEKTEKNINKIKEATNLMKTIAPKENQKK